MTKKIGVVLSGCGHKDGAEIHESVITLLALDRAGALAVCMAPNVEQTTVVNHLTGEKTGEKRNVLVESARIARGDIRDVATVKASELDALILPGGFGAALNLSNFATAGASAKAHPAVGALVAAMFEQKKPIGGICIAPAVLAIVLGKHGPRLTIGTDEATGEALQAHGAKHQPCAVESIVVDGDRRIVTTPAYMLGPSIRQVAAGIELLVAEIVRMI